MSKIVLGYLKKYFRDMGYLGSFIMGYGILGISLNKPLNLKLYAGAIIKSEARPAGVQLKRAAAFFTVTGITTKHAVCRITFMLYAILLYYFFKYSTGSFLTKYKVNINICYIYNR